MAPGLAGTLWCVLGGAACSLASASRSLHAQAEATRCHCATGQRGAGTGRGQSLCLPPWGSAARQQGLSWRKPQEQGLRSAQGAPESSLGASPHAKNW